MYTEEQAREKWCPFARIGFGMNAPDHTCLAATGNRVTTMDDECNCIASECMVWRWAGWWKIDDYWVSLNGPREIMSKPVPPTKEWERVGFCGLAGKE